MSEITKDTVMIPAMTYREAIRAVINTNPEEARRDMAHLADDHLITFVNGAYSTEVKAWVVKLVFRELDGEVLDRGTSAQLDLLMTPDHTYESCIRANLAKDPHLEVSLMALSTQEFVIHFDGKQYPVPMKVTYEVILLVLQERQEQLAQKIEALKNKREVYDQVHK